MSSEVQQQHRYFFNQCGIVRELVHPNKAILAFKVNGGADDKAILLSKVLTIDGKPVEENKLMQDVLQINDVLYFDCHVYDKGGGIGSGKDRCNFYAMKAWKNSAEFELRNGSGSSGGLIGITTNGIEGSTCPSSVCSVGNAKVGTGFVSELNPRKGVLTFDNNGRDERVLFLASKVYFFERRIGAKQPLTDLLSEGDPVQFEAVPQEGEAQGASAANSYCSWFANLVWKGKRPQVDVGKSGQCLARRSSCDSESDSAGEEYISYRNHHHQPTGSGNQDVVRGVGMIAKIVNEKAGIIWWAKSHNQFQSVWFTSNKTFLFGTNLANKNLTQLFREGDPVTVLVEKANSLNCPTKWIAKQVLISEDTASQLQMATEPPDLCKKSLI